jgi:hypothetical protein
LTVRAKILTHADSKGSARRRAAGGASVHIRSVLKPDGTWMVVEPLAGAAETPFNMILEARP